MRIKEKCFVHLGIANNRKVTRARCCSTNTASIDEKTAAEMRMRRTSPVERERRDPNRR